MRARFGGYGRVFEELFLSGRFSTHRKGSSGLEGVIFSDLLAASVTHIPLGVLLPPLEAGSDAKLVLNPPSDYEIEDGDQIFGLVRRVGRFSSRTCIRQLRPRLQQRDRRRDSLRFSYTATVNAFRFSSQSFLLILLLAWTLFGLLRPLGITILKKLPHAFAVSNSSIKEGGLSVLRADFSPRTFWKGLS